MRHPQTATPIQVDNSTCDGIMSSKIQQKLSKAMEMYLYWVRDTVKQKHFDVFWKPGVINLGDYFTKHHSSTYHKGMLPIYLHCPDIGQGYKKVC